MYLYHWVACSDQSWKKCVMEREGGEGERGKVAHFPTHLDFENISIFANPIIHFIDIYHINVIFSRDMSANTYNSNLFSHMMLPPKQWHHPNNAAASTTMPLPPPQQQGLNKSTTTQATPLLEWHQQGHHPKKKTTPNNKPTKQQTNPTT